MKVGFGRVEVTPSIGIRLGGYAHRLGKASNTVHDPLYVHSIFIEVNETELLLVGVDVLGFNKTLVDEIKGEIFRKIGLKDKNVFIMATHTHSSPETITPMWPNTYPYTKDEKRILNEWIEKLKVAVVEASMKAFENSSEAYMKMGTSKAPNLTFNRTYKNDIVDEEIPYLYLHNRSNDEFIIMNYACHPVCNVDLGISADYPGVIYAILKEYNINCLFTTGCAGNIDPLKKGRGYMYELGNRLALNVLEDVLRNAVDVDVKEIDVNDLKVTLNFRNPPDLMKAKEKFDRTYLECKDRLENEEYMWRLLYADEEYEVAKENKVTCETIIKILRINGEITLLSTPGEIFVEHGIKIKGYARDRGYKCIIISNYSEDYIGYVPDERAYEISSYEATLARWSRLTMESSRELISKIIELINNK